MGASVPSMPVLAYEAHTAPDPSGLLGCHAACGVMATVVPLQGAAPGEQTAALLLVHATPAPDAKEIGAAVAVGAAANATVAATPTLITNENALLINRPSNGFNW